MLQRDWHAQVLQLTKEHNSNKDTYLRLLKSLSQRSLHNAPIFRLLLKVAVNGTHQCDFQNFCGGLGSQRCCECAHPNLTHQEALLGTANICQMIVWGILAEGAIALSVTLSGGALFAS